MPGKHQRPKFDEDNPEWSETDFVRARPAHEILSPETLAVFPKTRGPQTAATKVPVSIRLSADVLDNFNPPAPAGRRGSTTC